MIRPTPLVAALAVGLLALTACGTRHSTDRAGSSPPAASAVGSPSAGASPSATRDPAAAAAAAKAEHDKAFPDIAARCTAEAAAATATAAPAGSGEPEALPTDPEAAKYAENHAFKKQATLTPEARCRGEAHAQRIKKALTAPGTVAPATEEALKSALTALGYQPANGGVYRSGGALGFSYFIQGVGPCVTGRLGTPATVEAHGMYMEGGCTEPRGGH